MPEDQPKRRRATKACVECHRRKVKCDVAIKGQPCSNCVANGVNCEVVPRKRRAGRFSASSLPTAVISPSHSNADYGLASSSGHHTNPLEAGDSSEEDGRHAGTLAAAIEDDDISVGGDATIHFAGNSAGMVGFVADLVADGNPGSAHYLVPHTARKALSNEDLQYLRHKGVFSVPPKGSCDMLIRLYFLHVHPLLPILDASAFLNLYVEHGYSKVNLNLLWSMIFIAAGFAEPETLSQMGYPNRKALKRAAYSRAKVLYDTAYDNDQIALIQSVILMSHWYADAEDRFEAWHWINVAISMCQVAGFHTTPRKSTRKSPVFNEARERLCRRIWWQCVVRDRWLSMVKGRPMRVRLEDCDLPEATPEDLGFDLRQLSEPISSQYFPFDIHRISRLWAKQVKISVLVGDIISQFNVSRTFEPPQDQLERLAALQQGDWYLQELESVHSLERLCVYHVRLLYNAATIALWRPRILMNTSDATSDFRRQQAIESSRVAAVSSNETLEEIISWDLVKYLKAQTITAIIPAMQIHLLDCKSTTTSIRMLGTNRLLLCMQLLTELKGTYWAAEFALRLFQRAHEKILQRQRHKSEHPLALTSGTSNFSTTDADLMQGVGPHHGQLTPQSLSSDEELLLAGFDWEAFPETRTFWNGDIYADDQAMNGFFSADNFTTAIPMDMSGGMSLSNPP